MNEMRVEVKRMKLSDLHPAEYNPRQITEEAFAGLGQSISRFGMLVHIVWNRRSGNIVGGHQRYKHLCETGETETDVVVVDLDNDEEVALNITLNNPHIRGNFSKEVMEQLRITEAQFGSAFKQLGLFDLFALLQARGFDRKKREPKVSAEGQGDGGDGGEPSDGRKPEAYILCPKCKSQWRLRDNEVVFNSVTGRGKPVGVKNGP